MVSDTGCSSLGCLFVLAPHVIVVCLPPCLCAASAQQGQWATASQWGSSPVGLDLTPCGNQPQVGVSCTPLEGGGHRLALPHSKAGPELSGPALAVRGPLDDLGETVSSPPAPAPPQKALVSAHTVTLA